MGGNGGHEEIPGGLCVIEEKQADEQSALQIKENGVAHFAAVSIEKSFSLSMRLRKKSCKRCLINFLLLAKMVMTTRKQQSKIPVTQSSWRNK